MTQERTLVDLTQIVGVCLGEALGTARLAHADNFFDMGGHSLLLPGLAYRLTDRLGLDVPLEAMLENPTPNDLARYLWRCMCGEEQDTALTVEEHDLARSDLELLRQPPRPSAVPAHRGAVFVTGATGFVGQAIVQALLAHSGYDIICLTRSSGQLTGPASDSEAELASREASQRLLSVTGDLMSRTLRLREEDLDTTIARCDWIIHCGARVNVLERYSRLRTTNVRGTATVLELAARYGTCVLYVSTTPPTEIALLKGYVLSKVVGEKLVAHASIPEPKIIVRLPRVVSETGGGDWQHNDLLRRMIAGSVQAGAFPWPVHGPAWAEAWVPRDVVGELVVEAIQGREPRSGTTICEVRGTRTVTHADVYHWLVGAGAHLTRVSPTEWVGRIVRDEANEAAPIAGAFIRALAGTADDGSGPAPGGDRDRDGDGDGIVPDNPTEVRVVGSAGEETIDALARRLVLVNQPSAAGDRAGR